MGLKIAGLARFGGGRGRGDYQDYGPPAEVVEAGIFQHPCEGEVVCKLTNEKVVYQPSSASAYAASFLLVYLLQLVLPGVANRCLKAVTVVMCHWSDA